MEKKQAIRCAIYTRKSTDEGLDQEYNTLDAQRDAGENYIKSQQHEGWKILPKHYDDGGFTGGNMDRPALKELIEDIKAGISRMKVISTAIVPKKKPSYAWSSIIVAFK